MSKTKGRLATLGAATTTAVLTAGPAFAQTPVPVPGEAVKDSILESATSAGGLAVLVIAGCAAIAFPIKGAWVAWRAGNKGVSKTGT